MAKFLYDMKVIKKPQQVKLPLTTPHPLPRDSEQVSINLSSLDFLQGDCDSNFPVNGKKEKLMLLCHVELPLFTITQE